MKRSKRGPREERMEAGRLREGGRDREEGTKKGVKLK